MSSGRSGLTGPPAPPPLGADLGGRRQRVIVRDDFCDQVTLCVAPERDIGGKKRGQIRAQRQKLGRGSHLPTLYL